MKFAWTGLPKSNHDSFSFLLFLFFDLGLLCAGKRYESSILGDVVTDYDYRFCVI